MALTELECVNIVEDSPYIVINFACGKKVSFQKPHDLTGLDAVQSRAYPHTTFKVGNKYLATVDNSGRICDLHGEHH